MLGMQPHQKNRRQALSLKSAPWFLHRHPPKRGKRSKKRTGTKMSSRIRSFDYPTASSESFKHFFEQTYGRFGRLSMTCALMDETTTEVSAVDFVPSIGSPPVG